MSQISASARITAVLGPTNTGKTHFALERMLGHASGMIGFPLRLLARENYDRIVRAKGAETVALITGEEKIIPPRPRWYVCTVESMPLDRRVAFVAVDEIQLCADPERGHVFTDRLLHARGMLETLFLGAETIKPLIRKLVPGIEFVSRPRLSSLSYAGPRKLNRLPPRSAVVAFSAADVYAMAEFVRRQRGGAAVVLGALSPRTRNAQVGMYQAGEVDYIVATDAIGMGLNMDVDHVAFAALRKFDGRTPRSLEASEVAQIAGRAGRNMNNGTFGTTADLNGMDPDVVEAVENHHFPPLKTLWWRNADLRFATIPALLASLEHQPDQPGLIRTRTADDHLVLTQLAQDADVARLANHPERVRLLWDVCQIPDFRKVMADAHARLLGQIFRHLTGPGRRLPTDWLAGHVARLDRTDGELDTLISRIAHVRTWTYVANRPDWVADPTHWQEMTRGIEDRLSDALHDRLTQRFVDKRTAHLVRRLRDESGHMLASMVAPSGDVMVEGHFIGRLTGFRFVPDQAETGHAAKAMLAAAIRVLTPAIADRLAAMADDDGHGFSLSDDLMVLWRGEPVGRLTAGSAIDRPQVDILASDLLDSSARTRLHELMADWLRDSLALVFAPLHAARALPLGGAGRGLVHRLGEHLGCMVNESLPPLSDSDRQSLGRLDIRFGVKTVYVGGLLKPGAQSLRAMLWAVWAGWPSVPAVPGKRVVMLRESALPDDFYLAVGFRAVGAYVIRADMLERFAAQARHLAHHGGDQGFRPDHAMLSALGADMAVAGALLENLGYVRHQGDDEKAVWRLRPRRAGPGPKSAKRPKTRQADGAFAALSQWRPK